MFARLQSLLSALFRRRRFEQDMTNEMQFHIQASADHLAASVMPRAEAMRRARAAFGDVDAAKGRSGGDDIVRRYLGARRHHLAADTGAVELRRRGPEVLHGCRSLRWPS
jgi:hypothetical protein